MTDLAPAPAARTAPRSLRADWLGTAIDLFLIALIVAGIAFRFSWTNWNQGTDLHPDEYGLTSTITRLAIPETLGDYFNTRISPLSPYQKYDENGFVTQSGPDNRMRWGQWPITIIRWAAEQTGNTGYGELRLMGRRLSALADTLGLFVVLAIGRRLYGRRVGLLATALSALAVLQIQQSHFMTSDTFALLFTLLAMYCAVRVAQGPPPPTPLRGGKGGLWYALFGVAFGMAMASRVNLLPLFGMLAVAAAIASADRWSKGASEWVDAALDIGVALAFAGVVALVTFRLTQPMAFRAETGDTSILTVHLNPDWMESMKVAQAESNGTGGGPPGEQWTDRPALVFPFLNIVLWGMGLPLGLAGWGGFAWAAWRAYKDSSAWKIHALPLVWVGGYFLFMGTRWVKSIRYFLPIYPFLALFAAWAVFELWRTGWGPRGRSQRSEVRGQSSEGNGRNLGSDFRLLTSDLRLLTSILILTLGTLAWAWGFTGIYRTDNTRIQASRWIYQNIPAPFNLHVQLSDGSSYTEPLPVPAGQTVLPEIPLRVPFRSNVAGTVTGFTVGHARSSFGEGIPAQLHVALAADPDGTVLLTEGDLRIEPSPDPRGGSFSANVNPVAIEKGATYYLLATAAEGVPVDVAGATVANESWDEGLPLRIDGRDAFGGLYRGLTMEVRWQDDENKRLMFLTNLEQVDYLFLPSQRGLWSPTRLPNTYPMTVEYYRALFDGRLGFDLVATFTSPIRIGPLHVSDVAGSAAWGRPPELPVYNDNPFAAEEAFSVYDHAPVWIFKKRPDFSIDRARAVLESVDLSRVVVQGPREATDAPTLSMLPPDRLAEQRAGGTWRDMFDRDGLLNRSRPVGVVAWWLTVVLLGWVVFPLTAAALPGLSDRGYPLAKVVALLVVAWLTWVLASQRWLPFTRGAILAAIVALALVSAALAARDRRTLREFLASHRRYVLVVEALALALFLLDLAIRFGNADLWHPNYGGEKPMDFAYLNAVLKSTSFPPYDPWFSGGYINYYYFGFVLTGVLVKLLGIVPSFAYNLILPTLFSCLGMGAFSVAYNLIAHRTRGAPLPVETGGGSDGDPPAESPAPLVDVDSRPDAASPNGSEAQPLSATGLDPIGTPAPERESQSLPDRLRGWLGVRPGPNPYFAGLMAALMIVVLGNLGEFHVLLDGYSRATDYAGVRTTVPGLNYLSRAASGATLVLTGQRDIPMGTGEWYWNATRIIPPGEGEPGPITEFPFFTFLYGDLHAHMVNLPLTLLALAWAVSAFFAAKENLSRANAAAFWALGGLAIGVLRPTNTWDFPLYLGLGALAVGYGTLTRRPGIEIRTLIDAAVRVVVLAGLAVFLFYPFSEWYVQGYTSAELWRGSKTTLESYLWIHGLFFFLIVTWLVRETRHWLASVPASSVTNLRDWFGSALFAAGALVVLVALASFLGYQIAVVAVPLMAWAGVLALRPGQAEARRAVLAFVVLGLLLTLVVEVLVLKGDIGRMNTVFKFYLQVWTLLSVSAAAALAWVWPEVGSWRGRWPALWTVALAVLLGMAAMYTVLAASAKIKDRFAPNSTRSLDGAVYMEHAMHYEEGQAIELSRDQAAIEWLQDHADGSPVIVEAQVPEYRWGSRYSINTGLPAVLGWNWHQRQQRGAVPSKDAEVWERAGDVEQFYASYDLATALQFLRKYQVEYVVVGDLERAYYPPEGLSKFERMATQGYLSEAFSQDGTVVYRVVSSQ